MHHGIELQEGFFCKKEKTLKEKQVVLDDQPGSIKSCFQVYKTGSIYTKEEGRGEGFEKDGPSVFPL